jgi:hypothetical protein
MPTWVDAWGSGGVGPGVVDHLREVRALGAGVGLWDMQLAAPGWSRTATWDAVQSLRRPGSALARHLPMVDRGMQHGMAAATLQVSERTNTVTRFHSAPSTGR